MNIQAIFPPTALCVACLSSERQLNFINDQEIKQIFCDILENFETTTYSILICYECMGRLKSVLRFQKQVQHAHQYLTGCVKLPNQPISMSRLQIKKTETIEFAPDPNHFKPDNFPIIHIEEEIINEHDDSLEPDELNDDPYSPNSVSDHPTSERTSKKVNGKSGSNDFEPLELHLTDTSEIKVENVIQKTEDTVNIKEEPLDAYTQVKVKEVMKSVTKYEFSESDDEPLKAQKVKKKVKREVKERKRERSPGVVHGVWVHKKLRQLNMLPGQLEMVVLSWEEVELERQRSLTSATYTRHEFRCPTCVIGFNHRFKLDSHLKKHLPETGDLECNVCKTRFKTQSALLCHRRRHRSRWRCTLCLSLFSRAPVAADHVSRSHGAPPPTHTCHVCGHTAASLGKLRVHLRSHAERQSCEQCGKTFRDKSSLRTHLYIHTNQMDFSCEVCDKKFRFKKALEIHSITHQASELLYCADCDMNFKNRLSFYQHMNYSMKHIHPDKIKYACEFCPRRFSKPARLQEHRLSLHLKLAPHLCTVDGCGFASASRPALRTHTRMVHRNKRLERNHVCHTCGKTYTTKKILEGHLRSHTGERPFSCAHCPATFSHDAALYNHNKLVHKAPFVRRQKPNAPGEEPTNWSVTVLNTEKVPTETVTTDP